MHCVFPARVCACMCAWHLWPPGGCLQRSLLYIFAAHPTIDIPHAGRWQLATLENRLGFQNERREARSALWYLVHWRLKLQCELVQLQPCVFGARSGAPDAALSSRGCEQVTRYTWCLAAAFSSRISGAGRLAHPAHMQRGLSSCRGGASTGETEAWPLRLTMDGGAA